MENEVLTGDYSEQFSAVIELLQGIDNKLGVIQSIGEQFFTWFVYLAVVAVCIFIIYIIFKPLLNFFR